MSAREEIQERRAVVDFAQTESELVPAAEILPDYRSPEWSDFKSVFEFAEHVKDKRVKEGE